MALLDEDVGNLFPLFTSWIHSRRVVRAGVKKEDRLVRRRTEEREIGFESESYDLGIIVWVVFRRSTDILEDCLVICFDT